MIEICNKALTDYTMEEGNLQLHMKQMGLEHF